ncbi:MAG: FG-GAP-like repeat-containing protein [Bacteroidia bacterium]|nr:FG-GAP-like repeat-containing protein [Bacteroidia bacterium]MCF8448156.1 FG-GAP-like repeat-containing protein [Bacteroidia bacterium]
MNFKSSLFFFMAIMLMAMNSAMGQGKVYWLKNSSGTISRANIDGTTTETLVTGASCADGAYISSSLGKVFWVEGCGKMALKIANLDGTNVQILDTFNTVGRFISPRGVTYDDATGNIYVIGAGGYATGNINSLPLNATQSTSILGRAIAINSGTGKLYYTSQTNKISICNTDGTGVDTIRTGLANSWGVQVDVENSKLYFADNKAIYKTNLDGTSFQTVYTFPTQLQFVSIAIDPRNDRLFWGSNGGVINKASLSGANPTQIISGQSGIFAIAVGSSSSRQSSNINFNTITTTSANAVWTKGDGAGRVAFLKADTLSVPVPADGTTYTGNAAFGSGTQIGTSGWYCVYSGTDSIVTVTGLAANTTYRMMVMEYSGTGSNRDYNISYANLNPNKFRTTNAATVGVPSITSFYPSSGPYGTTVTIAGNNFNTTATNNYVFFGPALAAVTNATATSLTVKLPPGATYSSIQVVNKGSGLSCTSFDYFKPTFSPAKITETKLDFEPKVDFQSGVGSQQYEVTVGELDGDGMPDIALINTYPDSTVSVFLNNSTKGNVSVTSRVDLAVKGRPVRVMISDVNGDGKKDLIVLCSIGRSICVFPNTSIIGTLSFGSRIDLETNANPSAFDVSDLNGDGLPELACSNQLNVNVSVFKNTSTSSSISFESKLDITAGSSPIGLKFGDIDGDGKPDMAVSNPFANTYSIYRNTSTSATISFASGIAFPADTFVRELTMADLDDNGKLDIVLVQSTVSRIAIAPNTSTIGNISFAPRLFFPNLESVRNIAIGNLDGDSLPDIVTLGGNLDSMRIFKNVSTPGNISYNQTGSIYIKGNYFAALAIADIDLDGMPDIINSLSTGKLSIKRQRYPISNDTISGNQSLCNGSSTTLQGSNVINSYNRPFTYKWIKSTTSAVSGFAPAGGADSLIDYSTSALTTTTWFKRAYYWDYTADTTAATKITVTSISSNTIGSDQTITSGSIPATLTGNTPTGGTFTYQWISSASLNTGYNNATGASTSQDYSPAALTSTTYYKRIVLAGVSCVDTSLAVTITVTPNTPLIPQVETSNILLITTNSATLGGNVSDSGTASVTERGVVYATTANPTTSNTKVQIGNGIGAFSQNITGLMPATTYHVRAYAINSVGTSYGADSLFTTMNESFTEPKIYNAFSPDGDGLNDTWVIDNASDLAGHEIVVFNIFGQEVFHQTGYDIPWDGTINGNLVPSGEYYYLIKGEKVNKKGAMLIRTK